GLAYAFRNRTNVPQVAASSDAGVGAAASPKPSPASTPRISGEMEKSTELFGLNTPDLAPTSFASWESIAARVALRFSLAACLAALLAFRPRRGVSVSRRNPYVSQTQILMAVVAAAMMM